jgi:methylglyoxal synthase
MHRKTLIGVLSSHDSASKNAELIDVLDAICCGPPSKVADFLESYHFVFTGGTFSRLILGAEAPSGETAVVRVKDETRAALKGHITVLPPFKDGGLIMLAYLVTQRRISIVWSFLTPLTNHWLNPEDLAFLRLCDVWRVKRLMNKGSVLEWLETEAELDKRRNEQAVPLTIEFPKLNLAVPARKEDGHWRIDPKRFAEDPGMQAAMQTQTIALISHDEMKPRMVEFAVDHENDLRKFDRILTTGTTGRLIIDNTIELGAKIHRHHSGPFGGDIEIATEILFDLCDTVIFFVDPLHAQPHVEDIRVVFSACMRKPKVRMLANEVHAREWMERVVRGQWK